MMTQLENERDYEARVRATRVGLMDDETELDRTAPFATTQRDVLSRGVVRGPDFEGLDIVAFSLGSLMMLGPLVAYAVGLGA